MENSRSCMTGEVALRCNSGRTGQEVVVQYTMAAVVRLTRSRVRTDKIKFSSTEQFSGTERTDQVPSASNAKDGRGGGKTVAGTPQRKEKS